MCYRLGSTLVQFLIANVVGVSRRLSWLVGWLVDTSGESDSIDSWACCVSYVF